jgi:hypothetical protein
LRVVAHGTGTGAALAQTVLVTQTGIEPFAAVPASITIL